MLSSGAKCYADCSIQTDSESVAEARDAMESTGTISCTSSVSLGVQPSTFEEKFTRPGTAVCKIAYSHSQTSQTPINTLILRPRQERKQSSMTIGCGRPSSLTFPTRRITSLPTSASRDFLGPLDEPFRVASMPQRGKFGVLQLSESQADGSDTIDIAYYSPDSTHDTGGPHCETERAYPTDLPQTPSPPSSPDSVMIIANEEQVSGSFLRRQSIDESGWITWASSPPRPIPALHGPSSLPYARCPSGAEGTITEGDDLSHKIWGLGIDDTQISNSRVNKVSGLQNVQQLNHRNGLFAMQPPTHEVIDYEIASFQNEKDAVIDLSKPSTFGHRANLNAGLAHTHLPHLAQQSRNVNIDILAGGEYNQPCSAVHNPQISKSSSNTMERDLGMNTFGLGLDWDLTAPSEVRNPGSSRNVDPGNRLNGAAPVFIPANNIDIERQKGMYMRPSSVTKPSVSQPHNREFAFNTVYQPLSHQDYHLPTPPSTASPLWSPIFSQPNDQTISEAHSQINTIYYLPKIYSPHLDPEEYASRLSEMVEQLSGHNLDHSIPRFSPIRHIPTKQAQLNAFQDQARKFIAHTKLPVSTKVDSIHDSRQIPDPPAETIDINDLLFSSERRRNISYQHPRSIPIARLIQRRLSSVVEEDAGRDGLLPTFRKKVSELDFNRLSSDATPHLRKPGQWQTRYSSDKHLEYTKGDEKRLESAVSVENAQLYVENSGAIVKLPQKHVGSCPNQAVNNSGARKVSNFKGDGEKENLNDSGHTVGSGKQKNKHKKNSALSQV